MIPIGILAGIVAVAFAGHNAVAAVLHDVARFGRDWRQCCKFCSARHSDA